MRKAAYHVFFRRLVLLSPFLYNLAVLAMISGCNIGDVGGENKVVTELIKPIEVSVSGNVVSKETKEPVQGLTVSIEVRDTKGVLIKDVAPLTTAITDNKGVFAFRQSGSTKLLKISLHPGSDINNPWRYYAVVQDNRTAEQRASYGDNQIYSRHDTTLLYASKDSAIELGEIEVFLANASYKTTLKGKVIGKIRGKTQWYPVPNAVITLKKLEDGTIPYSTLSQSDGSFVIENCDVRQYLLTIDGSNVKIDTANPVASSTASDSTDTTADTSSKTTDSRITRAEEGATSVASTLVNKAFVIEDELISLNRDDEQNDENTKTSYIDLDRFFLLEQVESQDLRMVLQWKYIANEKSALNLNASLSMGNTECNINFLGGATSNIQSSFVASSPASGFGQGTCYWPEFLGGESGDFRRAIVAEDNPNTPENENVYKNIAQYDNPSKDGSEPEIITLFKKPMVGYLPVSQDTPPNILSDNEKNLPYHHFGYYYNWILNDNGDMIRHYPVGMAVYSVFNASQQSIYRSGAKVKLYQGNSRLGTFALTDLAEDGVTKDWTVLLIEYGYKVGYKRDPENDIYFRVVPFAAFDRSVTTEKFAYEDLSARFNVYDVQKDNTLKNNLRGGIVSAYAGYYDDIFNQVYIAGHNGIISADEKAYPSDPTKTGSNYGLWMRKKMFLPETGETSLWIWSDRNAVDFDLGIERNKKINSMMFIRESLIMAASDKKFYNPTGSSGQVDEQTGEVLFEASCEQHINNLFYGPNGMTDFGDPVQVVYALTTKGLYAINPDRGMLTCSDAALPADFNDAQHKPCWEIVDQSECQTNSACVWEEWEGWGWCSDYPCWENYDQTSCESVTNCAWDPDMYMCGFDYSLVSMESDEGRYYLGKGGTELDNRGVDLGYYSMIVYLFNDQGSGKGKAYLIVGTDNGTFSKDVSNVAEQTDVISDFSSAWSKNALPGEGKNKPAAGKKVMSMISYGNNLFVGTDSGLYYYNFSGGDAKSTASVSSDAEAKNTWYQMPPKVVPVTFKDSLNNEQKNNINTFQIFHNVLYIGTDRGIYVFDPTRKTNKTYRLASFPESIKVNNFFVEGADLFVLTQNYGVMVIR